MKLLCIHIWNTNSFSIGELFINKEYFSDTLEDRIRPKNQKVKHDTAIPEGTYKIVLTHSPKFNRILPRLLDVPNFEGILIHPGNSSKDTSGCILVGNWDGKADWISNSKKTFDKLFTLLKKADENNEEISITIKHVYPKNNNEYSKMKEDLSKEGYKILSVKDFIMPILDFKQLIKN